MEEPVRQIANNCGWEGSVVVNEIKNHEGNYGFNGQTEIYEDLVEAGVIDPTKVSRTALENASSVAALLLMTEATINDAKEEEHAPSMPQGGGMGGMY